MVLRRAAEIGQEIVAMAHRLDVEEDAVEGEGDEAHEAELGGRVERPGHARRVARQDQGERGERHQHDEIGAGARQAEALLAVAQAAQDQAEPDHAVADDHDHREDGLARQAGPALAGQHDRQDQRDLDHGHRDGQHEGAVGLAGAVRDDVGVVDRGEHDGHQTIRPTSGSTASSAGGIFPATAEKPSATTRPSSGVTRQRIRLRPLGIALHLIYSCWQRYRKTSV